MAALRDIQSALLHDIYTGAETSLPYLSRDKDFAARLNIYRNNTFLGLTASLENIYPTTKKIVGAAFFKAMARDFIKEHHQQAGNRNKFGAELPIFLGGYAPASALIYLPDVAALEWAYFQSAIAEEAQPLSFEALSQGLSSDPAFILALHPSAHIVPQAYNALDIWQAQQHEPVAMVELTSDSGTLLVWRDEDHHVLIRRISPILRFFIEQCQKAVPFAEALTITSQHTDDIYAFQQEFAESISLGIFT